ncbi:FG-GAP repeat domain-containing protein [Bradyrhizobium sp. USDA 4529]
MTYYSPIFDANGDGASDILFRNPMTGDVGFWELNLDGSVSNWLAIGSSDPTWHMGGAGDFDGDGVAEIYFEKFEAGGTVSGLYHFSEDTGLFQSWQPLEVHGFSSIAGAADLNGTADFNNDGITDILMQDVGAFRFFNANESPYPGHVVAVAAYAGAGDFNGDDKTDIIAPSNNGSVCFTGPDFANSFQLNTFIADDYHYFGTGDFNGDGVTDLLFTSSNDVGFFQRAPDGTATWQHIGSYDPSYSVCGTSDYSSSGQAEVLFQNYATGDTGFYTLHADGAFKGWDHLGLAPSGYRANAFSFAS